MKSINGWKIADQIIFLGRCIILLPLYIARTLLCKISHLICGALTILGCIMFVTKIFVDIPDFSWWDLILLFGLSIACYCLPKVYDCFLEILNPREEELDLEN